MALSKMMQHYFSVKEKYKDCIIFYRLGDFYEMFFDDAIKASSLLDLTLTGRDCGLEERAPMCGIPFHASDMYISKLVSLGEKVAICEQLTEPNGKDLVERDVIRVITAGTVINNELIDEKSNNFLMSIYIENELASISWADITTGEFFTKKFIGKDFLIDLFNDIVKINPAEIITNGEGYEIFKNTPLVVQGVIPKPQQFINSEFNIDNARLSLESQLKVLSFEAFNIDSKDICICSAGALVSYLKETQKAILSNINSIKLLGVDNIMMLDINAIRNLELIKTIRDGKKYGSLLWLLDKTKTSMGARKLQSYILSPLNDIEKINERLNAVESFYLNNIVRNNISELLSSIKDIGRLGGKISNGNLAPKDCLALSKSLELLPSIKFSLSGINSTKINEIENKIGEYGDIVKLINSAIYDNDGIDEKNNQTIKYIKNGYNSELDELRNLFKNSKTKIAEIEGRERERTGIKTLKINYNRVFGYYIEITNSFKDKVPYDYQRRQTIANAERYVTDELKDLENNIFNAEDLSSKLELTLYNEIKSILLKYVSSLQETADAIAELDVLISLSIIAKENNYVKPEILDYDGCLKIEDGRHPVVEATSKQRFIPNDTILDCSENRTMIITGPNMAGKSTYMRQVALITLMAHIGSFVPAKSAQIPLTDRIFTRIGASDSLISDQSTFMVEMSEMANIVKKATNKSLLILDEIGRGTSTFDGLSIAWAVVEYVNDKLKAKTLFATHYHELSELEGKLDGVKNYKITVKEMQGTIIFLRKIMRGGANKSFGIEVAELAGIGKEITNRAKEILKKIEQNDLKITSNDNPLEAEKQQLSETERIIKELDLNNMSPMQAFTILSDLYEKVNK